MNWLYRRWYLGKDKGTEVIKGLSRLDALELINQWNKQSKEWKYELLGEVNNDD